MAHTPVITQERARDIEKMLLIPLEQFERFVDQLENDEEKIFTADQILFIASAVFDDLDSADILVRVVFYFHHFSHYHDWSSDRVINFLEKTIIEHDLDSSLIQELKQRAGLFDRLLAGRAYRLAAKSSALAADRPNLLTDVAVVTDLRPVFDDGGAGVVGTLVLHNLKFHVINSAQDMMQFSIDHDDLISLRDACDRAIVKASTSKSLFAEVGKDSVIIGDVEEMAGSK